jgi:hypothetical protein
MHNSRRNNRRTRKRNSKNGYNNAVYEMKKKKIFGRPIKIVQKRATGREFFGLFVRLFHTIKRRFSISRYWQIVFHSNLFKSEQLTEILKRVLKSQQVLLKFKKWQLRPPPRLFLEYFKAKTSRCWIKKMSI